MNTTTSMLCLALASFSTALVACTADVVVPKAPEVVVAAPVVAAGPAVPAPIAAAIVQTKALIQSPTDEAILSTFTPKFLSFMPPVKVREVLMQVHDNYGQCRDGRLLRLDGDTRALVRIDCDRGSIDAALMVMPEPPYHLDGLVIKPASAQ